MSQTYIKYFGWEIRDEISIPVSAAGDPAPPELRNSYTMVCPPYVEIIHEL